jgi:hypothetical protein
MQNSRTLLGQIVSSITAKPAVRVVGWLALSLSITRAAPLSVQPASIRRAARVAVFTCRIRQGSVASNAPLYLLQLT